MKPKIIPKFKGYLVKFPKKLLFYLTLDEASKAVARYYNKKRRIKK